MAVGWWSSQIAPYQHVVVVMSIVLGLSVTQLLKGIAQIYRGRSRVRPYWLHSAWVVLLVVFSLLLWWTYWNYRAITDWNFVRFVVYLSPMITFYFLTAVLIPDPADQVASLRDYYFAIRAGFFGTFAFYGLLAGLTAIVVRGLPVSHPSNIFRLGMIALFAIAMRSSSERVHAVVLGLSLLLMVSFIFGFQFTLA